MLDPNTTLCHSSLGLTGMLLFIWPAASDWEEIATMYSPDYNQLDLTGTAKACEKAVDGNRSAYLGAEGSDSQRQPATASECDSDAQSTKPEIRCGKVRAPS
ncbi:hypothetical protein BX661DRAFT_227000 [Kickxella alabastrina]|uniref:uncharacterized protein n=1 Tax=Kickxella alabastrina TaxID=61397 RepID=UPI00221FCC2A|nr:uncharacterized protein BX661DRAFT_227108 [Kickxella alabastrina]XP_051388705.1 uncharacterized protein BX661DRAFT_227000 [Kickxella alabastrina]KAI7819882.1 hypothetical protein BX661DRAFT_227108 [Kickxella alabastrina]KAI7820361.1 hypothetical protein BX661DRAFT_227000 [Kickxella alabastrina]